MTAGPVQPVLRRASRMSDVHPRAMLLEPWEAIYLPIPKVACTSMKALFARELEALSQQDLPRREDGTTLFPAVRKSVLYSGKLYPYLYSGYCTFSLVRNPYSRVLSFYRNKIESAEPEEVKRFRRFRAGMSFRECVEIIAATPDSQASHHYRSQSSYLLSRSGDFIPDVVGKFENIDADVHAIAQAIGMKGVKLDKLNASRDSGIKRYFDEEALRLVEKRYAQDFELLGYERTAR